MAIVGCSAGAKAMNQAWGPPDPSAVPVFPATVTSARAAARPVPPETTAAIIAVRSAAVAPSITRPSCFAEVPLNLLPSRVSTESTTYGCIIMPPLPIAAAITAI